jgi:hypothetical protein
MPIKAFNDINDSLDSIKESMLSISKQEEKMMSSISSAGRSIRANFDISNTAASSLSSSIRKTHSVMSGFSNLQSKLNIAVMEGTKLTLSDVNSRAKLKSMVESVGSSVNVESKRREDILRQAGIVEKAHFALVEGVEGVKDAYVGSNAEMIKSVPHIQSFTSGVQHAIEMTVDMRKNIDRQVEALDREIVARGDYIKQLERERNATTMGIKVLEDERGKIEQRIEKVKVGSREHKLLGDRLGEVTKQTRSLTDKSEDYTKAIDKQTEMTGKAATQVSKLKSQIPEMVAQFSKAAVVMTVITVAYKSATAAQDELRESMIETGMTASQQDKLITDVRLTQGAYNLTLEETTAHYGALAKQSLFTTTTTGMLDDRTKKMLDTNVKLSKVFGVGADEAADFQRNLQRLGMGKQIEGVGSAMLIAAQKTGMTNQEVFQLAKGFEGLGIYVDEKFRAKAMSSFLAVGAAIKDMGGDVQDVANLSKDMLDMTSVRGRAAAAILGSQVKGGAAALKAALKSGDQSALMDAMINPLKKMDAQQFQIWKISRGKVLGLNEQTMDALYKRAQAKGPELDRLKKQASLQTELDKSAQSSKDLNQAFSTTMETASRGLNRLKLAGGALLARIGEPLANALGTIANVLGTVVEKIADFVNWSSKASPTVKYLTDMLILAGGAYWSLSSASGVFLKIGGFLNSKVLLLLGRGFASMAGWIPRIIMMVVSLGRAILMAMGPVGWIITGVAIAALLIYKYWTPIKGFFISIGKGIYSALKPVLDFFGYLWDTLVDWSGIISIFAPFIGIPLLIVKNWSSVKGFFVGLFEGIWKVIKWYYGMIWDGIKWVFDSIVKYVSWSLGLWKTIFTKAASIVRGPFESVYGWVKDKFASLANLMMMPINAVIKRIPDFLLPAGLKKYKDELNRSAITPKVSLPRTHGTTSHESTVIVKKLQDGGIVQRPTLATVGESGPEAVIPLSPENPLIKPLYDLMKRMGDTVAKREERMQVDNSDVIAAISSLQGVLEKYMAFQTEADRVPAGMEPSFGWGK